MTLGEQFPIVLRAAQEGAAWAVTSIYRELHPPLLRYLRVQEPGDAEDLASETWLDAARGMARFEGTEHDLRRWLFTIARRRLVDLRRRRSRRKTDPVPHERLPDTAAGDVESEALDSMSTEGALARIAGLPRDQAEVVLLRVLGGLDANEVAQIVGKRPGTVRVLQHRALQRLAEELSARGVAP